MIESYFCDEGHETVTEQIDEGLTRAAIPCTEPSCSDFAYSIHRRSPSGTGVATHVWYKPGKEEEALIRRDQPHLNVHLNMGGLMLRPVDKKPSGG